MPETIVYNLEVVQVHKHDREGPSSSLGARECLPETVREQNTVRQIRQGIMQGLVGKPLLKGFAFGVLAAGRGVSDWSALCARSALSHLSRRPHRPSPRTARAAPPRRILAAPRPPCAWLCRT